MGMKGTSEASFREALNNLDLHPVFIYKPPDDARNWKPCDFMLWFPSPTARPYPPSTAWFEVKDVTRSLTTFPLRELRPSQLRGIATAKQLGIPYFLAIRWPSHLWSLVDAIRLVDWLTPPAHELRPSTSVARVMLESRFGISCDPGQLASMVRAALTEGL